MRIGLVIYGSLDTLSGGYLYDRKLVACLRQQGDQVEIVSIPWRNYPQHLGDNFSPDLSKRLARLPVDLLLQDELCHPSLIALNRQLKKTASYPLVSIVHHLRGSEDHPQALLRLYRRVERAYLTTLDGFVYNSSTTRRVTLQARRTPAPGVVAYPAGDRLRPAIGEAEISRRCLQTGPLRIFFLGNLIERKGLHTLLEALSLLNAKTWQLSVAGRLDVEPGYTRRLRARVEANGWDEQVRWLGPVDDPALAAELAAHHLLAMPSSYEGFGIAYLEGMGFGLPAIASTAGAAGEIIQDGQNGFLIPPGDARWLAERLEWAACRRQDLLELSLAALRRYRDFPTWDESMGAARRFLLSMLEAV